ncbi:MAG: SGNH/GDSL hydrolase family protein [Clostridia bacterium]|nr:SGNH/GDSL hydrolase family protein [Clostridia bacterium]
MKKILFQGDSITDCCRNRQNDNNVGDGYPVLVKAKLGYDYPGVYDFKNRGISGNRVVDVYARIKSDIINLRPDYMSILIGVNDVWHEVDWQNGVDADKFEKIYSMLIEEIKAELPDIKIMILEPFCLRANATENTEEIPDKWNIFSGEVRKRAQKAKAVAEKYNLCFVPLQDKFDEMAQKAENSYWLVDGVHPQAPGHELIAREWLKGFSSLK